MEMVWASWEQCMDLSHLALVEECFLWQRKNARMMEPHIVIFKEARYGHSRVILMTVSILRDTIERSLIRCYVVANDTFGNVLRACVTRFRLGSGWSKCICLLKGATTGGRLVCIDEDSSRAERRYRWLSNAIPKKLLNGKAASNFCRRCIGESYYIGSIDFSEVANKHFQC